MDLKQPEDYYIKVLLNKVHLKDVMTTKIVSINVDAPFSQVEQKMRECKVRHVPVVDENNKLVGLMSQRDLYRIHPPHRDEEGNWVYDQESLDSVILKHVMTKDPFALSPDNTMADALPPMVERKYGCIPIVDKDRHLCGIITQMDILKIALQILREH